MCINKNNKDNVHQTKVRCCCVVPGAFYQMIPSTHHWSPRSSAPVRVCKQGCEVQGERLCNSAAALRSLCALEQLAVRHLANTNSPNPFSKELSSLISSAHRPPAPHSSSNSLPFPRAASRRRCGPAQDLACRSLFTAKVCGLPLISPLKRNRSQFSLLLGAGGSISECQVDPPE